MGYGAKQTTRPRTQSFVQHSKRMESHVSSRAPGRCPDTNVSGRCSLICGEKRCRLHLAMLKPYFDAVISASDSKMGSHQNSLYSVRGCWTKATGDESERIGWRWKATTRTSCCTNRNDHGFEDRVKTVPGYGQRVSAGLRRF